MKKSCLQFGQYHPCNSPSRQYEEPFQQPYSQTVLPCVASNMRASQKGQSFGSVIVFSLSAARYAAAVRR